MTKNFYIATTLRLTKKPDWFDDFRKKYDWNLPYHITLKQWSIVDENKLGEVKEAFQKVASEITPIKISFDKLWLNNKTSKGDYCIMISMSNEQEIKAMEELRDLIKKKFDLYGTTREEFIWRENNFIPHITIGRRLDLPTLERAKKDLREDDLYCEAVLDGLILFIGKDPDKNWIIEHEEEMSVSFNNG